MNVVNTQESLASGIYQNPLLASSLLITVAPVSCASVSSTPGNGSVPEHFQKTMSTILDSLPGVLCMMDNILIFRKDQKEHDARLTTALERIQAASVTLNKDICVFNILGYTIHGKGISPDSQKTAAISKMASPKSTAKLRRFMGMVNQGKFSPQIASQ